MIENYRGRHCAPGRRNPLSLSSLTKGAVVATAAGALTFGLAVPAHAAPVVPQTAVVVTKASTQTRTVTASVLNVRKKATTSSKIMGTLKKGTKVKGTLSGSWFKITSGKHAGRYVSASYVTTSKAKAKAASKPAASSEVLSIAKSLTGIKYRYGGTTPSGFDCSGYVQYVFKKAGKKLPRTTTQQYRATTKVSKPKPGDLVFFGGSNPYHVGIYAGNGKMYDSPRTGKSTALRKIFSASGISYRRA